MVRRSARRDLQQHTGERTLEALEAPERTDEQVPGDWAGRLLAKLPPAQREVIDLAYFSGFTQSEIADRVGVPLGTVKGRARLGLERLRDVVAATSAA